MKFLAIIYEQRKRMSANFRIKREPRGLILSRPFRPTDINIIFYKSQTIAASSLAGNQGQ